jgi:ribosomal protein S6
MDQDQKKEYELAFLIKEETDAAGLVEALKAMGGEINLEGPVRKIVLAYEIKKETTAYFGFIQFMMEPAAAKSLEAALLVRSGLLRSLLMTPPTAKGHSHPQAAANPQRPAAKPHEAKAATPVLSNEALEKTIEEILK